MAYISAIYLSSDIILCRLKKITNFYYFVYYHYYYHYYYLYYYLSIQYYFFINYKFQLINYHLRPNV